MDERTTMTAQEWEDTLQRHNAATLQRHREEQVENAAERQVRSMYEQNRPTLDPATQKLWDDYVDARCRNICNEMLDQAADEMCKQNDEADNQMRKEFADEIVKLKKENLKLRKDIVLLKTERGKNVIDLPKLPLKSRMQE